VDGIIKPEEVASGTLRIPTEREELTNISKVLSKCFHDNMRPHDTFITKCNFGKFMSVIFEFRSKFPEMLWYESTEQNTWLTVITTTELSPS
jgi:hypothetical protein